MDFLIALQTHNVSNNQDTLIRSDKERFVRYGCNDKTEIVKRCTRSLIASVNYAQRLLPDWNFRIHIFDDHSTDEGVRILRENMSRADCPITLTALETHGLMPSLRACYEELRDNGRDLVMQAQDDYLFHQECFYQVIRMWLKFNPRFDKPLSLLPYNDPYRYWDHNIVPVRIVQGPDRHWRQTYQVPCTFVTHHQIVTKEWDLFDTLCGGHAHDPKLEDNSVNRLWQERQYVVMSPLPSLSLHFQTDYEKDPYIDWESWWNEHADDVVSPPRVASDYFESSQNIILNVGCGRTRLDSQSSYFTGWKEVRFDLVKNDTVDIVGTITELETVPTESVDAIWASHVVEHNYWHELPSIFRSFLRVLKPSGFAVIRVPDLGSIASRIETQLLDTIYETSGGPVAAVDMLYGGRWLIERGGTEYAHKTGFTKHSMQQLLTALNINAVIKAENYELQVLIYKDIQPVAAMQHPQLVKFYDEP